MKGGSVESELRYYRARREQVSRVIEWIQRSTVVSEDKRYDLARMEGERMALNDVIDRMEAWRNGRPLPVPS